MSADTLTGRQIAAEGLAGWAYLLGGLHARIHTPGFAAGLRVVNAIGAAAEEANHHPDLDLRYAHVDVRLSSHDVRGVTDRDVRLARRIGEIVADSNDDLSLEAGSVARWELALDTPDRARVLPFWKAALALQQPRISAYDSDELNDPYDSLPAVWFQRSGSAEPRQRWHLDVWVAPDQVQRRIDAALAAGGTLVSSDAAPRFWILADPEGNKVCLCTWQDRD